MQLAALSCPNWGFARLGTKIWAEKLATLKKLKQPQSVFLDLFHHSEHNGGGKIVQKLL